MSISFELDGRVVCQDEADPTRTLVIPAGTTPAARDAQIAAFVGAPVPPDGGSLSDWRLAVDLWGRLDEVTSRVAALLSSDDPEAVRMGKVARQRLEYANYVYRADLMLLKDVCGFTAEEVDQSLWRATRIPLGDYSGRWPV
ncbi:hypothetical protein [Methylorubrum thiocyanatum]|uniref:hypothetical protein n=1 Tax=Methylorubrum thiocyanatum TaxID=47958 RepID=UPI003648CB86